MLNKFKDWLGVEGVKITLLIPEEVKSSSAFVDGRILLNAKKVQTIQKITIQIIEKYTHGRGGEQKIAEFIIGEINIDQEIIIHPNKETYLNFALPFEIKNSSIDIFESKNLLNKGIAKIAKAIHHVHSAFRIIATVEVEGTALNPFNEKNILIQ